MKNFHRIFMKAVSLTAALIFILPAGISLSAAAAVPEENIRPVISFTPEEQKMMGWIIQQEVRGASLAHKRVIARVIVNRVLSEQFPDTVSGVITQKNQFSSLRNWYQRNYPPDEDTCRAVREVLSGEWKDDCGGSTFFYSPRWACPASARWFENSLTYLFELEGHRFFR